MNILFVHQNFPGQFKFLAPALASQGHSVKALTLRKFEGTVWNGVEILNYKVNRGTSKGIHPWVADFETKAIRGECFFRAAVDLRNSGYSPDVVIAHPGWGESLFVKEVWPNTKVGLYCEFFYSGSGNDVNFDPEFRSADPEGDRCRLHLKNLNSMLHFDMADAALSPTRWQASTFPEQFRSKISVIHDGIDTDHLVPNKNINLTLNNALKLTREDEVITFVNRNLEPYRGYHVFMRALPELLRRRPNARVLIVGGDGVSYGAKPNADVHGANTWKEVFIKEVRPSIPDADWGRVHFLGQVSYTNFLGLLQLSSVHVYLTYPFVLSWSLIEAMSAGCAIVASNTPPLHEVIENDVNGKVVDFFDQAALVDTISELLSDRAMGEKLGAAARETARNNYDLKTVCLPRQLEWVHNLFTA